MKKSHRKNLIASIAVVAALCIGYATVSSGAPAHNVRYTKHNLGTTANTKFPSQFIASTETEICVFCHTPHNAAAGRRFLWNKVNYVTTFLMYTGSPTLEFRGFNKPTAPSEVSKLCMTCHDGAGAVNAMANPRDVGPSVPMSGDDQFLDQWYGADSPGGSPGPAGRWGVNIGNTYSSDPETVGFQTPDSGWDVGRLFNDHPISFIYSDSQSDPTIKTPEGGWNASSIGGLPLPYSSDNNFSGYKLECTTCHDPHINYNDGSPGGNSAYRPFLRKTVNSSSLCFTCHNK